MSDRVERQSQDTETLLQSLERRLSELTRPGADAAPVPGSDLPIGLGFDAYLIRESPIVWIPPLDAPTPGANGRSGFPEPIGNLLGKIGGEPLGATRPSDEPAPVYTVPRNATLIGARGLTALIGRNDNLVISEDY